MKSYRGPSIDVSCTMLLYLAKWFQRRIFLKTDKFKSDIYKAFFVNSIDSK